VSFIKSLLGEDKVFEELLFTRMIQVKIGETSDANGSTRKNDTDVEILDFFVSSSWSSRNNISYIDGSHSRWNITPKRFKNGTFQTRNLRGGPTAGKSGRWSERTLEITTEVWIANGVGVGRIQCDLKNIRSNENSNSISRHTKNLSTKMAARINEVTNLRIRMNMIDLVLRSISGRNDDVGNGCHGAVEKIHHNDFIRRVQRSGGPKQTDGLSVFRATIFKYEVDGS